MQPDRTARATTPRPPTSVGPVTVAVHMLLGVVGLLLVGLVAMWWFHGGRRPAPAPTAVPAPALAPGHLAFEGNFSDDVHTRAHLWLLAAVANALGQQENHYRIATYASVSSSAPSTSGVVVGPRSARSAGVDPQLVVAELEFALTSGLDQPFELVETAFASAPTKAIPGTGSHRPGSMPVGSPRGRRAARVLTPELVATFALRFAPPDGGPTREWRAVVEDGSVRFVAR